MQLTTWYYNRLYEMVKSDNKHEYRLAKRLYSKIQNFVDLKQIGMTHILKIK